MPRSTGGSLKKIAIDIRALSTAYEHRGVGFYVKTLVRGLPVVAPDLNFVFFTGGEAAESYVPDLPNVEVRRLHRGERWVWAEDLYKLPLEIKSAGAGVFHCPIGLGPLRSVNLPYLAPARVFATVHDLHVENLEDPFMEASRREFRYRVQRWAVKRANLITVSEYTRRQLVENEIKDKADIQVIPNCIPDTVPPPADKENLVLFIGDTAHKNTAAVLSTFLSLSSRIPEWRFVMVGSRERIYALAGAEAKALQHAHILQIEENIPDIIMESLFAKAKILFMPSLSEGFGVPVLQAFVHEACAVISDRGSLPEVGGDAAVYVNPLDIGEMVSTLEGLTKNDSLQNALITKGHRRSKLFSWSEHLGRLSGLYREALRA